MEVLTFLMYILGRFASAATMEMYSGPTTVKDADHNAARKPSNFPRLPVVMCSAKEPGFFQYRKP